MPLAFSINFYYINNTLLCRGYMIAGNLVAVYLYISYIMYIYTYICIWIRYRYRYRNRYGYIIHPVYTGISLPISGISSG